MIAGTLDQTSSASHIPAALPAGFAAVKFVSLIRNNRDRLTNLLISLVLSVFVVLLVFLCRLLVLLVLVLLVLLL